MDSYFMTDKHEYRHFKSKAWRQRWWSYDDRSGMEQRYSLPVVRAHTTVHQSAVFSDHLYLWYTVFIIKYGFEFLFCGQHDSIGSCKGGDKKPGECCSVCVQQGNQNNNSSLQCLFFLVVFCCVSEMSPKPLEPPNHNGWIIHFLSRNLIGLTLGPYGPN